MGGNGLQGVRGIVKNSWGGTAPGVKGGTALGKERQSRG